MVPMQSEQPIAIDRQEWRSVPPELRDGLTRQSLSKRQLRVWTLVLQARQIPCRSEQTADGGQLLVPIAHFKQACEELRSYEEENRNWPPPAPPEQPQQENTAATIWILIALGMILDSVSIILIVLPIMLPILATLGGDPLWFGIVTVIAVEIGLLTPPFGLSIYVVKGTLPDKFATLQDIFLGAAPFVLAMLAVTIVIAAFPAITRILM